MEKEKFYNQIENRLGQVFILLMLIILSVQVIGRFGFGQAPAWIEEVARYTFVWMVYMSVCVAIYNNAHIKIEALLNIYPQKARRFVVYLGNFIFFLYALVIGVLSTRYAISIFHSHQISLTLNIEMGWFFLCIPVFHYFMAIRLVQLTYRMIKHPEDFERKEVED